MKWEYNFVAWSDNVLSNMEIINRLGIEEWELVQIVDGHAIMKKKVSNDSKTVSEIDQDNTDFEVCWEQYRRKGSKKKSLEQWRKLAEEEKEKVSRHILPYVQSVSDIKYQKDFERYLRDKCFLNVVYKDGKTLFDGEQKAEKREDDKKVVIGGVVYK